MLDLSETWGLSMQQQLMALMNSSTTRVEIQINDPRIHLCTIGFDAAGTRRGQAGRENRYVGIDCRNVHSIKKVWWMCFPKKTIY